MPLPASNTPWPPREWQPITQKTSEWAAWWSGDTQALWNTYHAETPAPHRRGLIGFVQRFFWGRTTNAAANRPSRGDLHIPVAADLCASSADFLYATPPTITTPNETTNQQIERYKDDGLLEALLTGAETGAALGGRYHRVTWDPTVADCPFLTTVDADHAIPEFRWGRLTAVTFWTVIEQTGNTTWRHLERHELTPDGLGLTYHGVYEGTPDNLGIMRSLAEHPTTTPLANMVGPDGYVTTGITGGLPVAYIPNVTPQIRWRTHPTARNLGRSDLDGIEPLMDALDETYSAWMRDIRLAKARIFVDRDMLTQSRPDKDGNTHTTFDLDQEIFAPLDGIAGSMADQVPIHPQQFNIRYAEHQATANELMAQIIHGARYSQASFADTGDSDITATEVRARQAKTATTRGRKIRLEKPAVQALIIKMLTVDQAVFATPGLDPTDLTVNFPPFVQDTTENNAQTVQTLRAAQLLSVETGVQMAHPDWDKTQVDEEVARIQAAQPLTDPAQWRPNTHQHAAEDED